MAVAGNAIHAYRCWLEDGKLKMTPTSTLRDLCDEPDKAVTIIKAGDVAIVAGSDVDAVRSKMGQQGLRLYRKTGSQWKRV